MNKASQLWYGNGGGDEQYTPRETVEIIIPYIQHLKDKTIWCPFDKDDSQFVLVLREKGFNVVNSHIEYGQDFFEYEPEHWDAIISNPPYRNKRSFWERCLDLKKPFALLLPVNILADSVINFTMKERGRERDFCMLVPNRRTKFYNSKTGEIGKTPTFKAVYMGANLFKEQLLLVDFPVPRKEQK